MYVHLLVQITNIKYKLLFGHQSIISKVNQQEVTSNISHVT
jgi:hypothetical protein